ncbi:ribonuclease H-like domain-containing protein [Tanacetum coccineum]
MAISSSSSSSTYDKEGYELALESLESRILVHEKNELAWGEKYEFQNYELKCREIKINNLNLELEKVVKERDELKLKIEKWEESSKNLDELLNSQMSARDKTESTPTNDRFSKADGYHVVPPPITGNFLTPRADISFAGLITPIKQNEKRAVHTVSTIKPVSTARPVSTVRPFAPKIAQTSGAIRPIYPRLDNGNPEILLQDHAVVDSGCSSHMTGNKSYLSDYKDYNRGFVAFGSDPKGGKIMGKGKIKTANLDFDDVYFVDELNIKLLDKSKVVLRAPRKDDVYSLDLKNIVPSGGLENQLNHNVKIIRCNNRTEFKNHAMNEFYAKKGIKREFSVARTPQQNGVAEWKNRTLNEAARTMLADSLLPIPFWAEAVNTACYVLNRVLVTKP